MLGGAHPAERVSFLSGGAFFEQTRTEVDQLLSQPGVIARGLRQLYLKSVVQFIILIGSWLYLIGFRPTGAFAVAGVFGLTIGFILVSFCVLHDANHGAFFRSRRKNHLLGWTSDVFLGFGSYAWRVKHNLAHHTYPNIDGYDDDIQQEPLLRLTPFQAERWWYRWQHFYIWVLYCFLVLRWHIQSDVVPYRRGHVAASRLPFPRGWDLIGLLVGKAVFVVWAFVIPAIVYPWWIVLSVYLVVAVASGVVMATVFQLAHCVEEVAFLSPTAITTQRREWAVHEVESTMDFCPTNRLITWLIGGLNYQIEHHLFPRVPHTLYPQLAPIVKRNAAKFGVTYSTQPSLAGALQSHYRHVKNMGLHGVAIELEMG